MELLNFDRNAHNLLDRGIDAVGQLAQQLDRLNDNLEEHSDDDGTVVLVLGAGDVDVVQEGSADRDE